ncbi:UBX domain-containing protein 1 [Podospora australis]|uniref:UBX domain-containing protein 1 n=1 Tax=Podospora australis TaxID=1536484 RepID=A0AAN6WSQ5_9PEZI|nr:UBX domain-containing protein 1 [Podospora australis]
MADQDHDTHISNFCELTGASAQTASEYLTAAHWDADQAVTAFFADQDEGDADVTAPSASAAPTVEPAYTGPRTLDGRPAPQYAGASSSSASKKPQKRTGLATLSSLGGGHNHDDDDNDDDDDSDDEGRRGPRDLFAGGEKSGLAVQDPAQRSSDPRKIISDIVAKAKANASQGNPEASSQAGPSRSRFGGSGQTLGGDGVESRRIPDPRGEPTAAAAAAGPVQERTLHLWQDGFSIDDGELRRFDNPQNRADLQMIREGRAPLHLMNVNFDQRVDVKLQHHNENYRPLPKIYRPFGGEGRRLGSPVPGEAAAAPALATTTTTATPAATSQEPTTGADSSQPTLMLRIQLPNGTRLPARFNTNQTVGDVYDFVGRASADVNSRPWVLSTTFPNKDHQDKSLVLGELAEFKKGGTAVVKWK